MSGAGEQTRRICAEHSGILARLDSIRSELATNSKDTRETKRLLVGILVSVVLAFVGYMLHGCVM